MRMIGDLDDEYAAVQAAVSDPTVLEPVGGRVWPVRHWVTLPSDVAAVIAARAGARGVSRETVIQEILLESLQEG